MMSRYDVIKCYEEKLLENGVDPDTVGAASTKSKKEQVSYILDLMLENSLFCPDTRPNDVIWNIYAEKQKEQYRWLLGIESREDGNVTRCYICSNYVGRTLRGWFAQGHWDFDTPKKGNHHWNSSHIFAHKHTKCGENFNVRICCRECNVRTGTSTPLKCAKRLVREGSLDSARSLAMKESIETMGKAFHVYFRCYKGNLHGV